MSLTRRLRDELCGVAPVSRSAREAELSGLLRFGGAWTVRDGAPGWVLDTGVLGVLRHAHRAFADLFEVRPTVEAHEPGGLSRHTRYRLRVDDVGALCAVGLVDADGHPLASSPSRLLRSEAGKVAYVRGALLAAGGISGAGQPPHLEIRSPSREAAEDLEKVMAAVGIAHVGCGAHGDAWRLACKSGEDIGRVLALTGAHGTFLAFDEGRLRRQLRAEATRVANADRANLGRAVAASARQLRTIEQLLADAGWERLPDELQEVALARLANPQASLAELARVLGTTRATVHRRLLRLERAAESPPDGWVASQGGDGQSGRQALDNDSGRQR